MTPITSLTLATVDTSDEAEVIARDSLPILLKSSGPFCNGSRKGRQAMEMRSCDRWGG
jgi:hypothetical protein